MKHGWPFADPKNVATISVRQVLDSESPILLVCHDAGDGCWQFLGGGTGQVKDARVVSLQEMFGLDPSIARLT